MNDQNKAELRRLAEAIPDLDWDSEFENHEQTGFCTVYAKPFEIDGEEHEGPTFVPRCTAEQARFIADAKASVLALLDENDELGEELGGIKNVNTELFHALKNLTMHARTSGGTAGPDAGLMTACDQAEKMLSLGGIGRAYMEGADSSMAREGNANS